MSRYMTLGAAIAALAIASWGETSGAAPGPTVADSLEVQSSIAQGAVLSGAVHWSATPKGVTRGDSVDRVEFLIDGAVRWTERHAPYYYQGDDAGRYIQYLYPTTLGRGRHALGVRLVTRARRRASTSATVTVDRDPPRVPVGLAGTWHRKMTRILKGTWRIRFAPDGIVHVIDPTGSGPALIYTATSRGRLTLGRPQDDPRAGEDGGFCPDQAPQPYHWKVSGKRLSITTRHADHGACRDRRTLFAAVWHRA